MCAHEEVVSGKIGIVVNEENEENGVRFSPDMVDERTKANFKMLKAHFSALKEMMVRSIQNNSTKDFTTACTLKNDTDLYRLSLEHWEPSDSQR